MEKHNGIITFSDETYKNIKNNIRMTSIGDLSKMKDESEVRQFYLNNIMLELENDLGDNFFGKVEVGLDTTTSFDFKTGKISLNPKTTVENMDRTEFLIKKCRYAGANAKSAADFPTDLYYRDIYHLYEILRYVYIRNIYNISKTSTELGEYYKEVVRQLTDPKIVLSKKFAKAGVLNYARYADASAAKFICEMYDDAKKSEREGCFKLLGYILYTESLISGYEKTEILRSKVPTTPFDETNKVLGINGKYDFSNLSLEERAINGFSLTESEKKLIRSVSFDSTQGKSRGTFSSFYGTNPKGIFK